MTDQDGMLRVVAAEMQRIFALRQSDPALPAVDYALGLIERSGWESWYFDGSLQQISGDFEQWLDGRPSAEGWNDVGSAPFAEYARTLALTQSLPSIRIGLTRAALITLHGLSAQGRATFRAAAEECLYTYMLLTDADVGRNYIAVTMYPVARDLTRDWNKWIKKPETHDRVPDFGLTYLRIFRPFVHGGSHAGFQQSVNRTRGLRQNFVDVNAKDPGGHALSFASQILQLLNDLVPLHPRMDRDMWSQGYSEFASRARALLSLRYN